MDFRVFVVDILDCETRVRFCRRSRAGLTVIFTGRPEASIIPVELLRCLRLDLLLAVTSPPTLGGAKFCLGALTAFEARRLTSTTFHLESRDTIILKAYSYGPRVSRRTLPIILLVKAVNH